MVKPRDKNIVIVSQFNINGSRGADAGKFISDYVSRDSATEPSPAYIPNPNKVPVKGDGVAFTLDRTAISRDETLHIAEHVQALHEEGNRAIQQMVISFSPEYLVEQNIVPDDAIIMKKGDYKGQYDDVRLRQAVRSGLQTLADYEGYNDAKAVGCVQWDTKHLHVHAVMYEDAKEIARKRGKEEKGVIKPSSFSQLTNDIDRRLTLTRAPGAVPTNRALMPTNEDEDTKDVKVVEAVEPVYVNRYLQVLQQNKALAQRKLSEAKQKEAAREEQKRRAAEKLRQQENDVELQEQSADDAQNIATSIIAADMLADGIESQSHENKQK